MIKYYDCVDDMRADEGLNNSDIAVTMGFYDSADGGGAEYIISGNGTENNVTVFELDNGKYATIAESDELIVEKYGINNSLIERPEWGLSNSQILEILLNAYQVFVFGPKEYEFDSTVELTSVKRNITFKGSGTTIKFTGTGTFITDDKSRYIYFDSIHFTTDESNNYSKDFFKTLSRNTYDFFFRNCRFTKFNVVIEYIGLSWDGIFNDCVFRNNNTAFRLDAAGTTFTIFNSCIIENCKNTYISLTDSEQTGHGANVHFNNCMIEGTEPSSGKFVNVDVEGADVSFTNCYFEAASPENAVYFVDSHKSDSVRFFGQNRMTINGTLYIKNAIDQNVLRRAIAQSIFCFDPLSKYSTMWAEQMQIPFVAHSDIPDVLPHAGRGQYGNSLNLSASRSSGSYSGETTRTDIKWHSDIFNNKKLRGRCFCIEYEINDLEELKSSEDAFPLRFAMYDDAGNAVKVVEPSLSAVWGKKIISEFIDASKKLYMFVPVDRDDVNSINFYSLRADNRLKAAHIYIL